MYDNERKNKTIIVNVSSGLGSFGSMQKDSKTKEVNCADPGATATDLNVDGGKQTVQAQS